MIHFICKDIGEHVSEPDQLQSTYWLFSLLLQSLWGNFFWTNLETFQRFYSFLFIFVCVVFSVLQCITWHYPSKFELQRISWKQFGPERSCQADKTFLLSFTLKCSFFFFFFFSTSKIHKAAKLLTCVSGPVWLLHSFMPHYVKTPHCLFKEHWTL